jgi:hypothetical protein
LTSYLEGIFSRGDRRLSKLVLLAWEKGCRFDEWDEGLKFDKWREAWTELGASREIAFTDLPPGRYAMSVRGRSAVGAWSETRAPLRIRVTPPFWKTWWFRVGGVIVFLGLVSMVSRARMVRKRRNKAGTLQSAQGDPGARASRKTSRRLWLPALTRQPRGRWRRRSADRARAARRDGAAPSAIKIDLKALGRLPDRSGAEP